MAKKQQKEADGEAPAVEAEAAASAEIRASTDGGVTPTSATDRPARTLEEIKAQREAMMAKRVQRTEGDAPAANLEAAPASVQVETRVPVGAAASPSPDDLTLIEGIGPRINSLLQGAGITTFAQLATTEVSRLEQMLQKAELRGIADPATWPEQAKLAAAGDWDAFRALTDQLKSGRQV